MYKLIGLFALAAVVVANDLTVGSKEEGTKIYDQKLEASPAIWRQDKNFTVNATEGNVISRVIITDLRPEKNGEAAIVEGGEGHNNVTIELKSPAVFRGFEFNVEVYVVPDNGQHEVSTEGQKPNETPKFPEKDPKVPISVAGDILDDNLRKTRKTEEQDKDKMTPKLYVTNEASTTSSSTTVQHQSTPISSSPTPVVKDKDGEKINIPITIGKGITTEVSTTSKSFKPVEKDGESDIIDPTAVNYQPTHLNNTEKSATENTKATDKTTEKVAVKLPEISNEGLAKDTFRIVRHTEDASTESDTTTSPSTTGYESTTELKDTTSSEDVDSSEIHIVANYNRDIQSPFDTIKPIGNNKDFKPPRTIGDDNVAVQNPAGMVPIPYNH